MQKLFQSTLFWLVFGCAIAPLSIAPLFVVGDPSAWSPLPIQTFILAILLFKALPIVLPIIFAIQFVALHRSPYFLRIQIAGLALFWLLTPFYFWTAWDYGLRYMGQAHTWSVFVSHMVGLILLSILALIAWKNKSNASSYLLNVLLFFYTFWGAFPILGEMP